MKSTKKKFEEEKRPIFFNPWNPEPEWEESEKFNPWDRRKIRKYKRW